MLVCPLRCAAALVFCSHINCTRDQEAASCFTRKHKVMTLIKLGFEQVIPSTFEEDLPHSQYSPAEYATATAKCKALDVAKACNDAQLIIASDTVRLRSLVPTASPWLCRVT